MQPHTSFLCSAQYDITKLYELKKFNILSISMYILLPKIYTQHWHVLFYKLSPLFGTNCTGKFFLWIIRWAQHSIAVGFNMAK